MSSFVHLHVHSQYSLLQGTIRIKSLVERAKKWGHPAVALTDSNQMFGAVDLYLAAKSAGVKPIFGCEVAMQFRPRSTIPQWMQTPSAHSEPWVYPTVILAKDLRGYQNLSRLLTEVYTRAPILEKGASKQMLPVADRDLLAKYKEGLIVLSGGLKGEIPFHILTGKEEQAKESLEWYRKTFGDDFYLELQDHGLAEEQQVNEVLAEWSQRYSVAAVATNDCYYLEASDAEAQEVLQAIELNRRMDLDRPKSLVPPEFYFKSAEEMADRFQARPEAVAQSLEIAKKCQVEFKFKDEQGRAIYHLPNFRPETVSKSEPFDTNRYFRELTEKGLERRFNSPFFAPKKLQANWPELEVQYRKRLADELGMIEKTGFSGYFLIVADFIQWAKNQGIPVGPGRGSGAGSLVAYSLDITDIDPIHFDLLFERFINPERVSMPDFDIDFCQDRRGEVIQYVGEKYGAENVCQIITYGGMAARQVLKDVARVFGLSFEEANAITALIPKELDITLSKSLEKEPRLVELLNTNPRVGSVFKIALKLEGMLKSAGKHAAGVIITEEPVSSYAPLYVGDDGVSVCQYDKDFSEKIGLVKFDFLGLKTLTVIQNAVNFIHENAAEGSPEKVLSMDAIPTRDPAVFELISAGDTNGVFQVESDGMKDLCMRLKPSTLEEDLTAICALYRPGPLGSGMVTDFIDRKHGRQALTYGVPALEPILKGTYGVILYQEQVMQIARELAGYSLGQADMLRRAMGKKLADEMARHRELFLKGAAERGFPPEKAGPIFDLMEKFADYGFNKSHSAAYGLITYQTAYLKTHYPVEFLAALLASEMSDTKKLTKYIADAKARGVQVLAPDVNFSQRSFSVEFKDGVKVIRYGLEGIKGVGGAAVDAILEERATGGVFRSVLDFSRRVSTRKVNKKVYESLIVAGAFDAIAETNRASLFDSVESLTQMASEEQEIREMGQASLFDAFQATDVKSFSSSQALFKKSEDWSLSKRLTQERAVLGFFLSGHPMEAWQKISEDWLRTSLQKIENSAQDNADGASQGPGNNQGNSPGNGNNSSNGGGKPAWQPRSKKTVKVAAIVTDLQEKPTKRGLMGIGSLEDLHTHMEVLIFSQEYMALKSRIQQAIQETEPILVEGELDIRDETPKIIVKKIENLAEAYGQRAKQVVLRLPVRHLTPEQMRALKQTLIESRGRCPVSIYFQDKSYQAKMELPSKIQVSGTPEFAVKVNRIFGGSVVELI